MLLTKVILTRLYIFINRSRRRGKKEKKKIKALDLKSVSRSNLFLVCAQALQKYPGILGVVSTKKNMVTKTVNRVIKKKKKKLLPDIFYLVVLMFCFHILKKLISSFFLKFSHFLKIFFLSHILLYNSNPHQKKKKEKKILKY